MTVARERLSRKSIVEEATRMISDVGLDQLSLRRLATQLGVTAPALYAHVSDKGDLLRAIAETGFGDLIERYELIGGATARERIIEFTRCYVDYARDEPEIFRLMFVFRPHEIRVDAVDNELDLATQAFDLPARAIAAAIADGTIHPSRDPLMTSLMLWTMSHGLATVLLLGMDFDAETRTALVDGLVEATVAGLALAP